MTEDQNTVFLGKAQTTQPSVEATLEISQGDFVFRVLPGKYVEWPGQMRVRHLSPHEVVIDHGYRPGVVADNEPRVLWGFDEGVPFTVFGARMSVAGSHPLASCPPQLYRARTILRGAHLVSEQEHVRAIRCAFPIRRRKWGHEVPVRIQQGTLSAWNDSSWPGLVWEPEQAQSLHFLSQRFLARIHALLELWTAIDVAPPQVEVQLEDSGWYILETSNFERTKPFSGDLLALESLSLENIANGLELMYRLGPLPFEAIQSPTHMQADTLLAAIGLEGFHRRVSNRKQSRKPLFRALNSTQRRGARDAAISAARESLHGLAEDEAIANTFHNALAQVYELSYAERLHELVPQVEGVAPGLLGPDAAQWVQDVKQIRNVQSHSIPKHDDFGETEITKYHVLGISGRWALRILVLAEFVDPNTLQKALKGSDRFMFALVNMDKEQYWLDFSAYDHFREMTRTNVTK
ncbi:MAG: HEPN domain-containing protein [Yaniella sp.]|uniref:HEPN domain-containing protein n=1 Tax=Yaniella sp. TaxID=2773929 RepID=UPI003F986515